MKYFVEEITTMVDGTVASALTQKETKDDAISGFHQAIASAVINPNVASIYAEAKNNVGGIYGKELREREIPAVVETETNTTVEEAETNTVVDETEAIQE